MHLTTPPSPGFDMIDRDETNGSNMKRLDLILGFSQKLIDSNFHAG